MTHDADCDIVIGKPCNCGGYEMTDKQITTAELIEWYENDGNDRYTIAVVQALRRLEAMEKKRFNSRYFCNRCGYSSSEGPHHSGCNYLALDTIAIEARQKP